MNFDSIFNIVYLLLIICVFISCFHMCVAKEINAKSARYFEKILEGMGLRELQKFYKKYQRGAF